MPKISIIIPCYNSCEFIERSLYSVCAQTLQEWECVIVDDGSTDQSAKVVEDYIQNEPRMRLVCQSNGGVCRARNKGFEVISPQSSYLLFLDSDDYLEPEMLEVLANYLDAHPRTGIAFCRYQFINEHDAWITTPPAPRYIPTILGLRTLLVSEVRTPIASILSGASVYPSASLVRRAIYQMTTGWDEVLGQHHEDLDLFLRIALKSQVHYVPQTLYRYRRYKGQSSGNHTAAEAERLQRQWEKFQDKWQNSRQMNRRQQKLLAACWRFREGRVIPAERIRAACALLKQGKIYHATRLYAGAALRYMRAFRLQDCWRSREMCRF